jgi:three-Cys-motif partner protein
MHGRPQFDRIGYWSEIKLEILREYASAYSRILAAQKDPSLYHIYVDAFAGAGAHLTKTSEDFVLGSPVNALNVRPSFREYHLIDIEPEKIDSLKRLIGERDDVHIYQGDCNKILLDEVFPQVKYEEYRRGLCILDPYGLDLDWRVISTAGKMGTLDVFLNFPVMDINRNVLWRDPEDVDESQKARMTGFWGDESWHKIAYRPDLFGNPDKQSTEAIVEAFRAKLKDVAGFARVPKPIPMRNSKGAIVYHLFFASQKDTAEHIVRDIFKKYESRGDS